MRGFFFFSFFFFIVVVVVTLQWLLCAWNKPTNLLDTWSLEEDADPYLSH